MRENEGIRQQLVMNNRVGGILRRVVIVYKGYRAIRFGRDKGRDPP